MQTTTRLNVYSRVYYITEYVYNEMILVSRRSIDREIGGILGGSNHTISTIQYDSGLSGGKVCSYAPNTHMMNEVIAQWYEKRILFYGIFHSHFGNSENLSSGDIHYIENIMKAMPLEISELLFPIVSLPQGKIFAYAAIIHRDTDIAAQVEIVPCKFEIQTQ